MDRSNDVVRRMTARAAAPALLVLALLMATPTSADAANYPLELVSPRAAGSAPASGMPAITSVNRIFWAYPGLEYNIRAIVIGGAYPYSFSLSNAPSGMTIDAQTGMIRWTNPTGTATPTMSVTDSESVTVSATWTITVDANRFIFLDAVNGREFDVANPGTGTRTNPFRRIRDLYSGDTYASKGVSTHVNKIAYFRAGTYHIDGFIEDANPANGNAGRMALPDTAKPVAWVAYPGETPTVDGRCTALSPRIGSRPCNYGVHIAPYGNGNNTYIDGLRFINMAVHAFRTTGSGNYQVFRRNTFSINGPTVDGVNQGFITTMAAGTSGNYLTIQDNVFEHVENGSCIKLYSTFRVLIEDNVCHDVRGSESEGIAAKGGYMDRVTIRHNSIYNVDRMGIGGNQHFLSNAEINFNRLWNSPNARLMDINQDGVAGPMYIYRNTVVGRLYVRNTDSADGPFYFNNNVIINNDPGNHLAYEGVTDASRIRVTSNLVGTASQNIVDASLNLTPAYVTYLGTHGHQIDTGSIMPPTNLRILTP